MLHVIGIGSPFGDDRVGWLMIDELRRSERVRPYLGCDLELLSADRPGAGLLSLLEGKSQVVIIDAVVTNGAVGQLYSWSDASLLEDKDFTCSSHGFGLVQTLALGRALGALPPQLQIIGIGITPPDVGGYLSPQLLQRLPMLVGQVVDCLNLKNE